MAKRRKSETKLMLDAKKRSASLKSIDANLDVGENLKISDFDNSIKATVNKLEQYNTSLGVSDGYLNEFNDLEDNLKDIHERMLTGVGTKYGFDSIEYEKAGGIRKSERKKPGKKKKDDGEGENEEEDK